MKTVRNLLYRDVLWSVFFVTIFFIALFFFFDFVDEMSRVGRNGYTMEAAALAVLLEQPGHVYELFPIAVLIGWVWLGERLTALTLVGGIITVAGVVLANTRRKPVVIAPMTSTSEACKQN